MVFKFTIDKLVNRYIPSNQTGKLPQVFRYFLGNHKTNPVHDYLIWLEILIASFSGIALLEGIFKHHTVFTKHHVPMIIASYGATAILCFNASQAPLAQPRSIFMGHFFSSLIGICIQKLFSLSQRGVDNYWASGALSVGVSSVLMSILNCVHPPAGASALLPSIDSDVRELSWWYLPVQIISSLLIITVACITGNIFRSYPVYWWSPADVGPPKKLTPEELGAIKTEESETDDQVDLEDPIIVRSSNSKQISISHQVIVVPAGLDLDELDVEWLETFRLKLERFNSTDDVGQVV